MRQFYRFCDMLNLCMHKCCFLLFFYRWQDLVVGAPQFFVKDGDIGGAVYVYINQNGDWNMAIQTRIDGAKNSMFGLAIESLGDLNLDGFNGL